MTQVGSKFRRPLTDEEIAQIKAEKQADDAFMKLWDIILTDAEGEGWELAISRGHKYTPSEYAIPRAQEEDLVAWMIKKLPKHKRSMSVHMTFLDMGPATYDPSEGS